MSDYLPCDFGGNALRRTLPMSSVFLHYDPIHCFPFPHQLSTVPLFKYTHTGWLLLFNWNYATEAMVANRERPA